MPVVISGDSGITTPDLTDTSLTSGRVVYAGTGGNLTGASTFVFDGAILGVNGISVGRGAGAVATNTAVGASALAANTSGSNNVAVGYRALSSMTTGNTCVAIGQDALKTSVAGTENTAVGFQSMLSTLTASANSALGLNSLSNNTTGNNNTAIGYAALTGNTTASNNTAVGYQAGYTGTTAANNSWLGYHAGRLCTGNYNTGMGDRALAAMAGAEKNSAFGMAAAINVTTGSYNTAMGSSALESLTTGSTNTAVGYASAYLITTGSKNSILGSFSGNQGGLDIRTSSNFIVLSDGDGNPRGIFDNVGRFLVGTTSFDNLPGGGTSNGTGAALGDSQIKACRSAYTVQVGVTTTGAGIYLQQFFQNGSNTGQITVSNSNSTAYQTSSDYRLKDNPQPMTGALAKVSELKPCTWTWKNTGDEGQGFIAHELQAVCPDAVSGTKDAVDEEGKPIYQGVDTSFLVATLTAAIQELKAEFDAYKSTHP